MIDPLTTILGGLLLALLKRLRAGEIDLPMAMAELTPALIQLQADQTVARAMQPLHLTGSTVPVPLTTGAGTLVGVILIAGAADTTLHIWDAAAVDGEKTLPGVRCITYDGYLNSRIPVNRALLAQLTQADAEAWLLFVPAA